MYCNYKDLLQFCDNIVTECDNFYTKTEQVNGYTFRIYNYRFSDYNIFRQFNAYELRGLTFCLDNLRPIWSVHKFFNINEHEDTDIDIVKQYNLRLFDKIDGSLIMPFFIDNKLFVKSKGSFFSSQAEHAYKFIMQHDNYFDFINEMENALGLQCIFEYVSPENQIVLNYDKENLILIQIRNKSTGIYYDIDAMNGVCDYYNIPYAKGYDINKIELDKIKAMEGIEGFVVTNIDNLYQKWKLKTNWYLYQHQIIGDSIDNLPVNKLISLILNNEIDDVLSILNPKSIKYQKVQKIQKYLIEYFNKELEEIKNIMQNTYKHRKDMALAYKEHPYFAILMRLYDNYSEQNAENLLKEYIIKQTSKLKKAEEFLKNIGDM